MPKANAKLIRIIRAVINGAYGIDDMKIMFSSTYIHSMKKDPCAYCGSTNRITLDHIHPKSKGGIGSWTNKAGVCKRCNQEKQDKSIIEYLLWRIEQNRGVFYDMDR